MFLRYRRVAAVAVLFILSIAAQAEKGKFRLHKFEQPIGEETYSIQENAEGMLLTADFLFTDRRMQVPLKASLQCASDYSPQKFAVKGNTSRLSGIDTQVTVMDGHARIREGKNTREVSTPAQFFTVAGYSPVSMEMATVRYWKKHGSPAQLATLPSGAVEIKDRGADTFTIGSQSVKLERYSVRGLVWGLETLWMDANEQLAAVVTRDAEFDHFEAVLEPYEPALAAFVSAAAKDEMSELEDISRSLPGRQTGTLAFSGATLIDGTDHAPVPNAIIVTRHGKVMAAGPADRVSIPKDATRVDLAGKYIIPGLWDMHAHYEQVEWGPIYLAAGVTTVRDVGNEFEFITAVRDQINSGRGLGPHMLLAGIVDGDGPMAIGITRVNSPEGVGRWVKNYHDAGFQQMKIYSSVTPDNVKAICADAHKLGMTVTGHIPQHMTIFDGVNDGMDQVNHIPYVLAPLLPKDFNPRKMKPEEAIKALQAVDVNSPAARELIAFLKQHGTVIDDTITIYELMMHPTDEPATNIEPGIAKVAPELRAQYEDGGMPTPMAPIGKLTIEKALQLMGALHRAGVRLVAGTDQTVPGFSVYRELELYVKAGFTPLQALQAATIVPARVMEQDQVSGTVEMGKRADFAILEANPLENISNVRTVRSVVSNGVLYDSAPLWKSVGFQP